ncbi:MAG: hypothetical protein DRP45_05795 [Candidatus Zixiibacteriota bacterium]|nr:MAG: hypothetical protein DRP45_05795 [candidate division Zixibacteria bacterium]
MILLIWGCSSDDAQTEAVDQDNQVSQAQANERQNDIDEIQEMLTEAITRWRHGDVSVLYDLEFEYFRYETSFDEYVELNQVKYANADTVISITVKDVVFFEQDSADAAVQIMFIGPSWDTTYQHDSYRVYYENDRWIRPYVSHPTLAARFKENRLRADSAAAAEAEGEDW